MYKIKPFIIISLLLLQTVNLSGQNNNEISQSTLDSIKLSQLSGLAFRYPALRQASFSSEIINPSKVNSSLYGKDLFKGELHMTRYRGYFHIPVVHWGNNTWNVSTGVFQQKIELRNVTTYSNDLPVTNTYIKQNLFTVETSFIRIDSLFNKPVVLNGGISAIYDPDNNKYKITYRGLISFNFIRQPNTTFSAGVVIFIDPYSSVSIIPDSSIPIIPYLSYYHKFKFSNLEFYADVPSRIMLRKEFSKKSALMVGNELGGNFGFYRISQAMLPNNAVYSTLELKSGITYEHLVARKIVFSISSGVFSTLNSKMFEKEENQSSYFISNKLSSSSYLNLKVSILPFWSGIKN